MKSSQTKEIDGVSYTVDQLGADASLDLFLDVVRVLGPTLGPVLQGIFEGASAGNAASIKDVDIGEIDFGKAIDAAVTALDKKTFKEVVKVLAKVTTVVGVGNLGSVYELQFASRGVFHQMKWLAFALRTQFMDFFDAFSMSSASENADPARA